MNKILLIFLIFIFGCSNEVRYENPLPDNILLSSEINVDLALKETTENFSVSSDLFPQIEDLKTPLNFITTPFVSLSQENTLNNNEDLENTQVPLLIKRPQDLVDIIIDADFSVSSTTSSCSFLRNDLECFLNTPIRITREDLVDLSQIQVLIKPQNDKPSILEKKEISRLISVKISPNLLIKDFFTIENFTYLLAEENSETILFQFDVLTNKIIKKSLFNIIHYFKVENTLLLITDLGDIFILNNNEMTKIYNLQNIVYAEQFNDLVFISNQNTSDYSNFLIKDQEMLSLPASNNPLSSLGASNGNFYFKMSESFFEYNTFQASVKELIAFDPLEVYSLDNYLFFNTSSGLSILTSKLVESSSLNINNPPVEVNGLIFMPSFNGLYMFNPINNEVRLIIDDSINQVIKFQNSIISFSDEKTFLLENFQLKSFDFAVDTPLNFSQTAKRLLISGSYLGEQGLILIENNQTSFIKFNNNFNNLKYNLNINGKFYH